MSTSIACPPNLTLEPLDAFVERALSRGLLLDLVAESKPEELDAAVTAITTEQNPSFGSTNASVWLAVSLLTLGELFRDSGSALFAAMSANGYAKLRRVPHWRVLVDYLLDNARPPSGQERVTATTADVSALAYSLLRGAQFTRAKDVTCVGLEPNKVFAVDGDDLVFVMGQGGDSTPYAGLMAKDETAANPEERGVPADVKSQTAAVVRVFGAADVGVGWAVDNTMPAQIFSDVGSQAFREIYAEMSKVVSPELETLNSVDDISAVSEAMSGVYSESLTALTEAEGSAYVGKSPAFMKSLAARYLARESGDSGLSARVGAGFDRLMATAKGLYEQGVAMRRQGAPRGDLLKLDKDFIQLYKAGVALLNGADGFVAIDEGYVGSFGFVRGDGGVWGLDLKRVPQIVPVGGARIRVVSFPKVRSNPAPAFFAAALAAAPITTVIVAGAVVVTAVIALAIAAYLLVNKIINMIEGFVFSLIAVWQKSKAAYSASRAQSAQTRQQELEAELAAQVALLADNDPNNDEGARTRIERIEGELATVRGDVDEYSAQAAASGVAAADADKKAAEAYKRSEASLPEWLSLTPGQKKALKWAAIAAGVVWVSKKFNIKL